MEENNRIIDYISEIAGAGVGAGIGLLVAGPVGAVGGAIASPIITNMLKWCANEAKEKRYSTREGKNIVKVLLENYGYDVIDLGKDVEYMAVVDAVKENDVKLAGLSALMTTTLKSMEETIKLLREHCPDCKIMVGGAVLTPDYAMKINADFYCRDAKESVDVAKKILG